ncbi:MAG: S8 family serine peptidase [Streptosporangiales bacterium]|nr:S8 family serine peptidase [Streptosporangiales bacterium]
MGNLPPYDAHRPPHGPGPAPGPYGAGPPPPGGSIAPQHWGQLPPPPAPVQFTDRGEPSGAAAAVILAFIGLWTALLAVVGQLAGWFVDQQSIGEEGAAPWVAVLALGLLAGLPSLIFWRLSRHPQGRLVARTWTIAAAAVTLLVPVRLLPSTSSLLSTLVLAAALAVFAVALSVVPAFRVGRSGGDGGTLLALAAGLLTVLPWTYFGAFGGLAETVAVVLLALALGWFTAVVLAPVWHAFAGAWSRLRASMLGGLVGSVTVLVVVAGATPRATAVLLAVCVPVVGFVCAAVSYAKPRRLPTIAAVAAFSFGPLAFFDPDEVNAAQVVPTTVADAGAATGLGLLVGLVVAGAILALAGVVRRRLIAAAVLVVALVVSVGGYAVAGQHGFSGDRLFVVLKSQSPLGDVEAGGALDVRRQTTYDQLVSHAERTQRPLRGALDRIGVDYTPYYLVNAIEVEAGAELRPWLSRRAEVAKVLDSPRLRPVRETSRSPEGPTSPPERSNWNLTMIRVNDVSEELGVTGKGVVVGQSDSGVDGQHPALRGSYRGRDGDDDYNWLDPWFGTSRPTDRGGGHGTHTLGTAVGKDVGVAPGAEWMGCTNLGRNVGNPALYLDCLQFMLAPYPADGDPFEDGDPKRAADVLNNSWGCPPSEGCDPNVLRSAIRALTTAGIFVAASAGNTGPDCSTIEDPIAIYDDSFTVAAVNDQRDLSPFSSRGPVALGGNARGKPDLAAPGQAIWSAVPNGQYTTMDGTSMATPHVTGTVALMWSANPELKGDVEQTAKILRSTTQDAVLNTPSGCGGSQHLIGSGILDAFAAVKAAERAD